MNCKKSSISEEPISTSCPNPAGSTGEKIPGWSNSARNFTSAGNVRLFMPGFHSV
jgi:hypothetical protein